jgi:hypothetical protein
MRPSSSCGCSDGLASRSKRISELEAGMIYLSEQMSVSPAQRFATPPALKHLPIETGDHSDSGLAAAATKLIVTYESEL